MSIHIAERYGSEGLLPVIGCDCCFPAGDMSCVSGSGDSICGQFFESAQIGDSDLHFIGCGQELDLGDRGPIPELPEPFGLPVEGE